MSTHAPAERLAASYKFDIGKRTNPLLRWTRLLLHSKTGTVGFIIVTIICMTAIFAPLIAPYNPAVINVANTLKPPFWMTGGTTAHILGTDNLGRDILSRIIYGSQISLLVGLCAVLLSGLIGVSLGIICGFYGGRWFDAVIMRIVDAKMAIPGILFMLVIIGVFGPSVLTLIVVMGITNWTSYTRLIRGEVLSLKQRDFVRAARSLGTRDRDIMRKHILPNIFSTFIVVSTLSVGGTIVSEASLSFLGLGIQPPTVSWGYMLSEGKDYLATSWWLATFPGVAITTTVLGIIFLGDWLRDVMDPRSQGRRS
jgi:peptide/nickel transport system permease protein